MSTFLKISLVGALLAVTGPSPAHACCGQAHCQAANHADGNAAKGQDGSVQTENSKAIASGRARRKPHHRPKGDLG